MKIKTLFLVNLLSDFGQTIASFYFILFTLVVLTIDFNLRGLILCLALWSICIFLAIFYDRSLISLTRRKDYNKNISRRLIDKAILNSIYGIKGKRKK